MSVDITLSTGQVVKVFPVSAFVVVNAMGLIPLPPLPMADIPVADHFEQHPAPPESEAYQAYLVQLAAAERERNLKASEATLLAGLREVVVPGEDDWFDDVSMAFAGIKRREGLAGRRLDYLQYALLAAAVDMQAVYDTLRQLDQGKEDRLAALEAGFSGEGQRPAAGRDPAATGPG